MSSANIFDVQLTTEDKISKAKIKLHKEAPFFSYLVEYLRFKESKKLPTMGVDKHGNCYYNADFVDKINDEELRGVIAHEVLHPALRHIQRQKGRNILINGGTLWNVAIDISVNHMLVENGFSLPSGGIIPCAGKVEVFGITVENIPDKSSEDIYEELKAQLKKKVEEGEATLVGSNIDDGSGETGEGFDKHIYDDGEEEEQGIGSKEIDWNAVVAEAYNHSQMIGKSPAGFQREFDDLHKSKINWRSILRRTVASKIPFDFSYRRPNRKYISQDIYMPSFYGESIKVIVAIDTSGSISQQDLTDFISEIIGIAGAFSQVEFRVLTHDVDVHDDVPVRNGHRNKLKALQPHGGGGTSHKPLYEYIKKKKLDKETRLLVCFTDGYSDYPERAPFVDTIFVLGGAHIQKENMPTWATTICIE